MTVGELIEALKKLPEYMEAVVWDEEQDDHVPVVEALFEDGSTEIVLLTKPSGALPVHKHGSCGGECDRCDEQSTT